MQIVAALFVENFEMRQAPGPSTRLDLTGAMFSMASPEPAPVTLTPHLVALIYCPPEEPGQGVFEVIFTRSHLDPADGADQVARNVSPFSVEPGKFTYRLVRSMSVAPPPTPDGKLRLIDIEGLDRQACGGTHLSNTAASPPIRITKVENKGRHNRRVRFAFAE